MMNSQKTHAAILAIAQESIEKLDSHPIGGALVNGTLTAERYAGYLSQVALQVRGSAPMLQRAGERLCELGHYPSLAALFSRKSGEEDGHDVWALDDIAALGLEREVAKKCEPCSAVKAYWAWTGHLVEVAPAAVLGLAFVLEWFGSARAGRAAESLVAQSGISNIASAVTFLKGHADADVDHVQSLLAALSQVTAAADIEAVLLSARVTSMLYIDMIGQAPPLPVQL